MVDASGNVTIVPLSSSQVAQGQLSQQAAQAVAALGFDPGAGPGGGSGNSSGGVTPGSGLNLLPINSEPPRAFESAPVTPFTSPDMLLLFPPPPLPPPVKIIVTTTPPSLVPTTHDVQVNPTGAPFTAQADFGGVFTFTSSDGSTPVVTYALSLAGPPGTQGTESGLTSGGLGIFLYDIGGVIFGSTAADVGDVDFTTNTIFTISVDGNGVVTQTQLAEIDHAGPGDTSAPYNDQIAALGPGLVNLTATATIPGPDGTNVTASATFDLDGNIQFEDDGPSIDVTAGADAGVLLTTQDAQTMGAASNTSAADFSGAFGQTFAFGADGPGTTPQPVLSYALSLASGVSNGANSGLDSNGAQINLFNVNGVIYGSTTNVPGDAVANAVFSISVDNGVVTLTQFAAIDQPIGGDLAVLGNGLVNLTATATVTDGDADSATDSAAIDLGGNIQFADDVPANNAATVNINVDEDELTAVDGHHRRRRDDHGGELHGCADCGPGGVRRGRAGEGVAQCGDRRCRHGAGLERRQTSCLTSSARRR